MSQVLTVNISDEAYNHLQTIAEITRQPMERLVQQSIEGNLPPSVASAPPEAQPFLLNMQTYSVELLRQIAGQQVKAEQQQRHVALLEKNSQVRLTAAEAAELAELRQNADHLMLQKAYAWALLRWHGQALPTVSELPIN
jgi:hypothetical protein